jgi:hypothetical protein
VARRARDTGAWPAVLLGWTAVSLVACASRSTLPAALSDREFWTLIQTVSESPGAYTLSDNLVSNEPRVAENVRWLRPSGGVYIGVGPEQNFSYVARLRSAMAFIVDIRQENRNLHLLYKALFEVSSDRVEFVSRLFSRPRPPGLTSGSSVDEIFRRFNAVSPSPDLYRRTAALVRERLLTTHGFPLSAIDLDWVDRAFTAFYTDGPAIQFWGTRIVEKNAARPSYLALMTARDMMGRPQSFLATEDGFQFIRDLQSRNRIVPVVGDFGGIGAIRRVGEYVRDHADLVRAFYGSNVGVYLTTQQMKTYCRNLAALPAPPDAWFIESDGVRTLTSKLATCQKDTGIGERTEHVPRPRYDFDDDALAIVALGDARGAATGRRPVRDRRADVLMRGFR